MISIFKIAKTDSPIIDVTEAFNIWNTLRARYHSLEFYQMMDNFVHDRDFSVLLNNHISNFNKQAKDLEKNIENYKLKAPTRPPLDVKTSIQVPQITDKFIYRAIFNHLITELMSLSRATRTSFTNDSLRDTFAKFLMEHIKDFEELIIFGKVKGWSDIAPVFNTALPKKTEPLSVAEANHIWDHLNERYDEIQLTQYYLEIVHDTEFKQILKLGLATLEQQAKVIENLALKYEVPLPERPPASQKQHKDPEFIEDKFIYRNLITGIQGTLDLHIRAVVEASRFDDLRTMFRDNLAQEINIYGKFLKYGKAKGWSKVVPIYSEK